MQCFYFQSKLIFTTNWGHRWPDLILILRVLLLVKINICGTSRTKLTQVMSHIPFRGIKCEIYSIHFVRQREMETNGATSLFSIFFNLKKKDRNSKLQIAKHWFIFVLIFCCVNFPVFSTQFFLLFWGSPINNVKNYELSKII